MDKKNYALIPFILFISFTHCGYLGEKVGHRKELKQDNQIQGLRRELRYLKEKQESLKGDLKRLQFEIKILLHDIEILKRISKKAGVEDDKLACFGYKKDTPIIEGKVIEIKKKNKAGLASVITVSIGAQDGVRTGMCFLVGRNGFFICKVIVKEVSEDMSTACVVEETRMLTDDRMKLDVKPYDYIITRIPRSVFYKDVINPREE
jgi:hypothetical protein